MNDAIYVDMSRITYEVIRDGGMADASVCRALHKAVVSCDNAGSTRCNHHQKSKARPRRLRSVAAHEHALGGQRGRDVHECEEETGLLHWVPYVHFGV